MPKEKKLKKEIDLIPLQVGEKKYYKWVQLEKYNVPTF